MAKRLILMIEVKEVLYRWTQGMGKKTIARSLGLARNTIREILNQAMGFGLQKDSPIESVLKWNMPLHLSVIARELELGMLD